MRILANIDPARLKRWLMILGVVYLLFPRDLVPDYLGRGLGLIDDATVIAFLTWFYRKHLREFAARGTAAGAGSEPGGARGAGPQAPPRREAAPDPPDAHRVLGVARGASPAEIDSAYKARMKEYHPDKVAHLGSELQDLAHRKVIEIQRAYAELRK